MCYFNITSRLQNNGFCSRLMFTDTVSITKERIKLTVIVCLYISYLYSYQDSLCISSNRTKSPLEALEHKHYFNKSPDVEKLPDWSLTATKLASAYIKSMAVHLDFSSICKVESIFTTTSFPSERKWKTCPNMLIRLCCSQESHIYKSFFDASLPLRHALDLMAKKRRSQKFYWKDEQMNLFQTTQFFRLE